MESNKFLTDGSVNYILTVIVDLLRDEYVNKHFPSYFVPFFPVRFFKTNLLFFIQFNLWYYSFPDRLNHFEILFMGI